MEPAASRGGISGIQISSDCITICVAGDFNRSRLSSAQQSRLVELITALQRQFNIHADHVVLGVESCESLVCGLGVHFPLAAVQSKLVK